MGVAGSRGFAVSGWVGCRVARLPGCRLRISPSSWRCRSGNRATWQPGNPTARPRNFETSDLRDQLLKLRQERRPDCHFEDVGEDEGLHAGEPGALRAGKGGQPRPAAEVD